MIKISRRTFLGSALSLPLVVGLPAAAAHVREPYVFVGESVNSIIWHLWERPTFAPTGPLFVHEVLPWDGQGYPIVLAAHGWFPVQTRLYDGWYDFEWSNLRRDVPDHFWRHHSTDEYPNLHSYVREQRFGESPEIMRETMARNARLGAGVFPTRAEPQWRPIT
ncbi:hypothetical protein NKJ28_00185 [Mesorhizobium sp. M0145]|uniref:hypothetical protein n=1 Tax=Mesorhizobium sp. M0145 TaxID=2956895 RepID=UPI0033363083